jgi:deoxyadenosine/deoxycytidine kinase
MGKLITIVGNNGSGKTTLARALGRQSGFRIYLESHQDRPYQPLFSKDVRRYALPNQIDYLVRRAEQEHQIRNGIHTGVQDGGLDQDYYLYTKLFHYKGFLEDREFSLCQRTYQALRAGLPVPDLIVWLRTPLELLRARLQVRARIIDLEQIVTLDDLPVLEGYLMEWLDDVNPDRVMAINVAGEDQEFSRAVTEILDHTQSLG